MKKYQAHIPDTKGMVHYSEEENETWSILIERQKKIVEGRACQEFLEGLDILKMPTDRVPQCADLNKILEKRTGFQVVPVEGLITQTKFFDLLADRKFPAATFIRTREDLDYLKEPDIFHEFFGHCPLLTQPAYADFIAWYGQNAKQADAQSRKLLARLFWFTIEFGLLYNADKGFTVYGGGILSSKEETVYAVESAVPMRHAFDAFTCLRTPYHYDEIQKLYFYLEDLTDLYYLSQLPLLDLAEKAKTKGDVEEGFILC